MEFNRRFVSFTVASLLLSTASMTADGSITFSGKVTDSTCSSPTEVSVAGSTASVNLIITLPNIPADALNHAVGTLLGHAAFKISPFGCATASTLRTVFDTLFALESDAYVAVAILTLEGSERHEILSGIKGSSIRVMWSGMKDWGGAGKKQVVGVIG